MPASLRAETEKSSSRRPAPTALAIAVRAVIPPVRRSSTPKGSPPTVPAEWKPRVIWLLVRDFEPERSLRQAKTSAAHV